MTKKDKKDKKKNKKCVIPTGPGVWAGRSGEKRVWRPALFYKMEDIENLARTIIAVNPFMKDRTVDAMTSSILETIKRTFNENCSFVSTAGWFCLFDEWEENTFVDLYVTASMVNDKLFGPAPVVQPKPLSDWGWESDKVSNSHS